MPLSTANAVLVSGSLNKTEAWVRSQLQSLLGSLAAEHPDCLSIHPSGLGLPQIRVEDVRSLIEFLSLKSQQTSRRIVILWEAEKMNLAASNALLKILEEPPTTALLILVSRHPRCLLATVRDRCMKIRLGFEAAGPQPLSEQEEVVLKALECLQQDSKTLLDTAEDLAEKFTVQQLLYFLMKLGYWIVIAHSTVGQFPANHGLTPGQQEGILNLNRGMGSGIWAWLKALYEQQRILLQDGVTLNAVLLIEHLLIQWLMLGNQGRKALDGQRIVLNH